MKILFTDPLIKFPTKLQSDGRRSDIGIRWSIAYLIGYLRANHPEFEFSYKSYRFSEYQGDEINLNEDLVKYDIICISSCTNEFPHAYKIAVTASNLGKIVIMGGIFPSANPHLVLNTGVVDYVVIREGEETIVELISCLKNGESVSNVKGIAYKNDEKIIINEKRQAEKNIDKFVPALDIFPIQKYSKLNVGSIYSARGCINKCSFCSTTKHWEYTCREHSIDFVLSILKYFYDYSFNRMHFLDESITNNKIRLTRLFNSISEQNFDFKIKVKSRLFDISYATLDVLFKSGVYLIQCGIENIKYDKNNFSNRKNLSFVLERKIDQILERGLQLNLIYQLGMEDQNIADLMFDKEFILKIGQKSSVHTYLCFHTPHPYNSNGFLFNKNMIFLSGNLNDFNHKRIVAVPKILGRPEEALLILYNTYTEIVDKLNNQSVNPLFDLDYIYNFNSKLKPIQEINYNWS